MGLAGFAKHTQHRRLDDEEHAAAVDDPDASMEQHLLLPLRTLVPAVTAPLDQGHGQRQLESPSPAVSPLFSPPYRPLPPDQAAPVAPEPRDVLLQTSDMTPPAFDEVAINNKLNAFDLVVGGALAPVYTSSPMAPSPSRSLRREIGLRLPSFDALGIAAPHPHCLGFLNAGLLNDTAGEKETKPSEVVSSSPAAAAAAAACDGDPTPRPDVTSSKQNRGLAGDPVDSPFEPYVNSFAPRADDSVRSTGGGGRGTGRSLTDRRAHYAGSVQRGNDEPSGFSPGDSGQRWVDDMIAVLLANLRRPATSLSVLSHALPSPSPGGHICPNVVAALHHSMPGADTMFINVFHAMPGRSNIADMPTSPPVTPAALGTGEDYFTSKIFDSAVSIPDYQQDFSHLARSPRPVVRPSSIDVSVVERYIPPTNTNEIETLFNPAGPSVLIDRLVELSPDHGNVVFIYPTRRGGQTFMREYLSPVLDRALRSMAIVHNFPSDFSRSVGSMVAVDALLSHDQMTRRMHDLCTRLSAPDSPLQRRFAQSSIPPPPSSQRQSTRLVVAHAAAAQVHLARETWARDWWVRQEKARIRSIVTRFANNPHRRIDDAAATPIVLLQQLLDDVVRKSYSPGQAPHSGIEISVFVLRREIQG